MRRGSSPPGCAAQPTIRSSWLLAVLTICGLHSDVGLDGFKAIRCYWPRRHRHWVRRQLMLKAGKLLAPLDQIDEMRILDPKAAGYPSDRKKVLVSGCFDLLHSGHVEFFREAAEYGDLYVRIGSDSNIRALKAHETMYSDEERLFMAPPRAGPRSW